jgi:hypothetical protein
MAVSLKPECYGNIAILKNPKPLNFRGLFWVNIRIAERGWASIEHSPRDSLTDPHRTGE